MGDSAPALAQVPDTSTVFPDAAALPQDSTKHNEPPHALTPPTSEDNNKFDEASSPLTEVNFDDDDDEEIEPDHYWGDGKVPVFKPVCRSIGTMKECF